MAEKTIAQLQADVDRLKEALHGAGASVARVSFQGRTVEYRSVNEIIDALNAAERELARRTGQVRTTRRTRTGIIPRSGL